MRKQPTADSSGIVKGGLQKTTTAHLHALDGIAAMLTL